MLDDKAYYFSPSGRSVIAYVAKGRGAIALGDPIGPPEDTKEVIIGFQQFCERNDWYPAFYESLPDDLDLYQDLGLRVLRIGEEAIVDLHTFNLKGKANQNLRNYINRSTKAGYQINEITIDLMQHRTQVESGTMDFLFISMFQQCQQLGYDGFN